jgi:hypothetical protein
MGFGISRLDGDANERPFHPLSPQTDRKFYEQLSSVDPTLHSMLTGIPDPAAIEYYYGNRYKNQQTAEAANARAAIRYAAAMRGLYSLFAFAQGPADYDLYQTQCLQLGFASGSAPDRMSHFISERTKKLIQDHVLQALELALVPRAADKAGESKDCFGMTYLQLQVYLGEGGYVRLAEQCVRAGREDAVALIIPDIQRLTTDRSYAPYARFLAGVAVEVLSLQAASEPVAAPESPRKQAACALLRSLGLKQSDLEAADARCGALSDRLGAWF